MHEIGHLAEDSDRSPEEIAETMRKNGTYGLLEEEMIRQEALDLLVETAVPVPMPEEEEAESGEDVPGTKAAEPETGEARVEARTEVTGAAARTITNEGEE